MSCGFGITLYSLSHAKGTNWSASRVSWLMIKIFLGSSFLGFEAAHDFSDRFGPLIILVFSVISSTLLLTMLISLLSNVFAAVQNSAEAELRHQEALRIIERAKSDPLNSFAPPLNLIALAILLPVNLACSPHWKHRINVFVTKALNLPILLLLALVNRAKHNGGYLHSVTREVKTQWDSLPRGMSWEPTEGVAKLFAMDLTDKAVEVAMVDEAGPSTSQAPQRAPFPTVDPRSSVHRSNSLGPRSGHGRFNSVSSPLARMFAVPDVDEAIVSKQATSKSPAVAGLTASMEERLEAIEKALSVLVGEVVKAKKDSEEEDKPPLTGISGEYESTYE